MRYNMNKLNIKKVDELVKEIFDHKITNSYSIPKIFKNYTDYQKQLEIYQKQAKKCSMIKFHKPKMEIKSIIKKDMNQSFIVISYRTSDAFKCNYIYEEILKYYLSKGLNSNLYDQLRVKNALTYHIDITNHKYIDIGTFNIQFDTKSNAENIKFAIQLVLSELEKINQISDDEFKSLLKKVKTKVIGITKGIKFNDLLYLSYSTKQQQKKYLESKFYDTKYKSILSIQKRNFINYFKSIFRKENLKIIIYSSKKINISL